MDIQFLKSNKNKSGDYPNGGFPPIIICNNDEKSEDDKIDLTKKEFTTHKNSISIRDLLEKRRKNTPFIQIAK